MNVNILLVKNNTQLMRKRSQCYNELDDFYRVNSVKASRSLVKDDSALLQ